MAAPQATPAAGSKSAGDEPSLGGLALSTVARLRDLVADVLGLAAMEARLAGLSLAGMLLAGLAAAFAVMAFWLMLQAGLIVAFSRLGIDPLWLLAIFTVTNGVAAFLLLLAIRRLSRNLMFRATAAALRKDDTDARSTARDPAQAGTGPD